MNRRNEPAIADTKQETNAPPRRPLPPRPSAASTATLTRPILKSQSEPPPGESTQAYDQRELSRLLVETDPTLAQDVLDRAFSDTSTIQARSTHDNPTVRPPALPPLSETMLPVAHEFRERAPHDTIPDDDEDLTVAYHRPEVPRSPKSEERTVAHNRKPTPTPALPAERAAMTSPPVPHSAIPSPTPRGRTEPRGANLVENTLVLPNQFELDADNDSSHPTGPRQRPLSLLPPPSRTSLLTIWLVGTSLLVAGLFGIITAYPERFGQPGLQLRAQYERLVQSVKPAKPRSEKPSKATAKPHLVEISIVAEPLQAKLYLDGRETSNPLKIAYPADDVLHELRAEVVGRPPKVHRLKFDRDVSVVLGL